MCGRFVRSFTVDELILEINEVVPSVQVINDAPGYSWKPHFNLAPSTVIPVVSFRNGRVVVESMRWGFDSGVGSQLVINARAESIAEKPMFRNLLPRYRCVVPMDGFYEWHRDGKRKTPFYVAREDSQRMWVAGVWRQFGEESRAQVVLLTKESEEPLQSVHHRSPCQLTINDALTWTTDDEVPQDLFHPDAGPRLSIHRVSSDVNTVRNNLPDLIVATADDDEGQLGLFD